IPCPYQVHTHTHTHTHTHHLDQGPLQGLPRVCGLVITGVNVLVAGRLLSDVTRLVQAAEPVLYGLCVGVVLHGVCLLAEEATSHFTQRRVCLLVCVSEG